MTIHILMVSTINVIHTNMSNCKELNYDKSCNTKSSLVKKMKEKKNALEIL